MSRPGRRGGGPPSPSGARLQPWRSSTSPAPAPPALPRRSADPDTPASPRRLESSFSVEALLARPDPRAPATPSRSVSACAALWTASSGTLSLALPWVCPAPWLPAYLSVGLCQSCPQSPAWGLRVAHFYGLQGLGVTGMELAPCPGPWGTLDWATVEDFQDTERPQKRVRTMFNLEQLEELEKMFAKQHNLVGKKRTQLASRLNLTENQVRVWFQNRRVKYQKQQRLKMPAVSTIVASLDKPTSTSDTSNQREDAESAVDS